MRKLPIGIQSFEELRKEGYIYIDKTKYIWNLVQTGKYYFLSRPRRFGKSLLISTIEAYFEGKKELFQGLEIEMLESESDAPWTPYPVLHLSLSGGEFIDRGALVSVLDDELSATAEKYGIDPDKIAGETLSIRFKKLIRSLKNTTGKPVVVLVDEYDKPLLSAAFVDEEQEERNRETLKPFFSSLKDVDSYLKFVFFTGVTKFSKVSIFSDLNQLEDISLTSDYSCMCGITQEELEGALQPELKTMADKNHLEYHACLTRLARMYDGYHFAYCSERVYNPFSLFNALKQRAFANYWFETGTPTFLVRKLEKSAYRAEDFMNGVEIDSQRLMNYQADDPDPIPVFYQAGYLTICGWDPEFGTVKLTFPNDEVKYSFLKSL